MSRNNYKQTIKQLNYIAEVDKPKQSEQKLQHDLIMWFSQTYPEFQDRLFMVQNNTYSQSHGNRMKSLGLKKGVSDLMFIGNGFIAGIELKAPESIHKTSHIKEQLKFGEMLIESGHYFIMTSSFEDAKDFISGCHFGMRITVAGIQFKCLHSVKEKIKGQTVKF